MPSLWLVECTPYAETRAEAMIYQVCAFPPRTVVYLADAAAIKVKDTPLWARCFWSFIGLQEVTSSRARFPKRLELYEVLMVFGGNIVASEGEEWKRHRTIAAPAFSEVRNVFLCWSYHFLKMTMIEKYSTGMGRNHPDYVRPIRQCMGRQTRNRVW